MARSPKARRARPVAIEGLERLEDRSLLTPVNVILSNGNLLVTGSGDPDTIRVEISGTNQVTLVGSSGTTFTGAGGTGSTTSTMLVTGSLTINTGNGNDSVTLSGVGANAMLNGKVSIDLGSGNDTLTQRATSTQLRFTNSVNIVGGQGDDTVGLGLIFTTNRFIAGGLTIDNGTGGTQTVILAGVTVNGNLGITNSGTGLQSTTFGLLNDANTITGNVTINQNGVGNTGGNLLTVARTTVGGSFIVNNGATTAANISTIGTATIGGALTATNGSSGITNTIAIASGNTVGGNVTATNGSSAANIISVNGSTLNGKSAAFTNGAATLTNSIGFGLTSGNTIAGPVAATNNSATGANLITISRGTFNGSTTLNNKLAGAASNTISVGLLATTNVVGNLVITNAASTGSNNVILSRTTTSGKNGDVSIANGSTATTNVTLGGLGQNNIGGDLTIRNQATTGVRTTSLNATAVTGRSGLALFNVNGGNTVTSIGATTLVSVTSLLKIEDGTGSATVDVQDVLLGNFNFIDLGGGVNVIDFGGDNGGTAVILGSTRITTGIANDIVRFATQGDASFGGMVAVTLGAGDDTMTVGANASSPAFLTGSNFQFDGGTGVDSFTGSRSSLADYEAVLPGKKLKSKITNFESYSLYNDVPPP